MFGLFRLWEQKGFLSPSYAAWIFGLTVFIMIVFFGKISNAHFENDHSFGANIPRVDIISTFGLEILGTFFLMGVIAIIVTEEGFSKIVPPLSIGGTVALISFFIGPFSWGSFNPALYFIAPVIGCLIGAAFIAQLRKSNS